MAISICVLLPAFSLHNRMRVSHTVKNFSLICKIHSFKRRIGAVVILVSTYTSDLMSSSILDVLIEVFIKNGVYPILSSSVIP